MKNKRDFLREFYEIRIEKLPFIAYFQKNKDLRKILFDEYLKTDLKPNLRLYTSQYFTDKEIQKGFRENHAMIPEAKFNGTAIVASFIPTSKFESRLDEIEVEFYKKVIAESLEKKFFSYQLTKTETFEKLTKVYQFFKDFKDKAINEKDFEAKQYSDEIFKGIIRNLESIKIPKLTNLILTDFVSNQQDIKIDFLAAHSINKDLSKKKYRELKMCIDNSIGEYIKEDFAELQTKSVPENEQKKVKFSFNNNFDNVNNLNVYNYFKKELVEKNYLDLETLEEYLNLAFEKKTIPNKKITLKIIKTKRSIRQIFYKYYLEIAYKPYGNRSDYIKLLTDYFQGFEYDKVKNNFNQ